VAHGNRAVSIDRKLVRSLVNLRDMRLRAPPGLSRSRMRNLLDSYSHMKRLGRPVGMREATKSILPGRINSWIAIADHLAAVKCADG
jgi:hypothetical protein